MTYKTVNQHIFPIIEVMMDKAMAEVEAEGEKISCAKGCNHCCYMLVEITWEEAIEYVNWLSAQEGLDVPLEQRVDIERAAAGSAELVLVQQVAKSEALSASITCEDVFDACTNHSDAVEILTQACAARGLQLPPDILQLDSDDARSKTAKRY